MSGGYRMHSLQRQVRMRILHRLQKGICPYCTVGMVHPDTCRAEGAMDEGWAPSLEHVICRSQRGTDQITNLLLAHKDCNRDRGTDTLPHYVRTFHRKILGLIGVEKAKIADLIAAADKDAAKAVAYSATLAVRAR